MIVPCKPHVKIALGYNQIEIHTLKSQRYIFQICQDFTSGIQNVKLAKISQISAKHTANTEEIWSN